jgi:transposase
VIYRIDERRNREAWGALWARLLESAREATGGDLSAILGSDRLSVYNHWSRERHQHCLSHVQRTLAGAAVAQVDGWVNAKAAHDEVTNAFRLWDGYRRGELDREALAEQMEPVKAMMQAMLRLGVEFGSKKNRGLFQNLLREWDRLWVFVEVDGVEPTNNRAEQALRRAVIWRKTSFGSQSETGRRFAERMLTVVGTARLRGIAVLDYLTRAVGSHQAGLPIPLLPQAQPP